MSATPPERRHRPRRSSLAPVTTGVGFDREHAIDSFRRNREHTLHLFEMVEQDAYESRPIALRQPIVFYEGHFIVFSVNTLLKSALGQDGIDEEFETLFARGIDPDEPPDEEGEQQWPSRDEIHAYAREAERRIVEALETGNFDEHTRRRAVWVILEHEVMHHETLMYMLHRLSYSSKKRQGNSFDFSIEHPAPERKHITIPAGEALLGQVPGEFGWDNEKPMHRVNVNAFDCDEFPVANQDYRKFLEAGGYDDRRWWDDDAWQWKTDELIRSPLFWEKHNGEWFWRGMFELIPLPPAWPVWVTLHEARAYARWAGRRVMTEPEYHRAAFSEPDGGVREHPWGNEAPPPENGNFDFQRWDPAPVDGHPGGASAWGVRDLVGNGWEWTSTEFGPFEGFEPDPNYPRYSVDFFDGKHYVLKGASPVTSSQMIRSSFRNWFRPNYPYVYAKFRTVASVD